jgi:cytochrome c biogenesis protein CcmG/thiol:disulfide interchange protein DsbE
VFGRPSRTVVARLAVLAVVALAALLVVTRGSAPSTQAATVSTQKSAWRLPRLDGPGQVSLASLVGRPVVVNFFASWCTACQGELPGLADASNLLKGKVSFVGVDSEENGDGLSMARRYGIGWWPLALDTGGAQNSGLHDDLGDPGMPVTAFYAADGRLLAVVPGAISETDLRTRVRDLYGINF